jgi:hypothetical protein
MTEWKSLFTAQEFIEKLRHHESEAAAALTGLVKLPDDDSDHIMFAFGTRARGST